MKLSFSKQLISEEFISLDDETLAMIPEGDHIKARENEKSFFAKKFSYKVYNRLYDGFYVRHAKASKKQPVIILNRGGTGVRGYVGAKYIYTSIIPSLIKSGFVVIGSQYMSLGAGGAMDEMGGTDYESIVALKSFIDEDVYIDQSCIGVYGVSRGAIATYRLMKDYDWVNAAVVISGLVDLLDTEYRPEMTDHYKKIFGGTKKECQNRSVLSWPQKLTKKTPILIMYGASDWRVNPLSGLKLSQGLLKYKVPHRFIMWEGDDHHLSSHIDEIQKIVIEWLVKYVQNEEKLPDMNVHGR